MASVHGFLDAANASTPPRVLQAPTRIRIALGPCEHDPVAESSSGEIDQSAHAAPRSNTDFVIPLVGRHQRSAARGIRLARDRARVRLTCDALVAEVASDHRLANEPHGGE